MKKHSIYINQEIIREGLAEKNFTLTSVVSVRRNERGCQDWHIHIKPGYYTLRCLAREIDIALPEGAYLRGVKMETRCYSVWFEVVGDQLAPIGTLPLRSGTREE